MRRAIGLALLATLALPAWADDKPGGDEKLVGTWVIVKEETSRGTRTAAEGHEILRNYPRTAFKALHLRKLEEGRCRRGGPGHDSNSTASTQEGG
jgi:hypothetical protein